MMKVGLLGGSFDPIHNGHVEMAKEAYRQLGLDEVWFIPTADTPLKQRKLTCYEDRVEMIIRAIAPYRHFYVSRIEEHTDGKNYTIDTIRKLNKMYPDYTFYFEGITSNEVGFFFVLDGNYLDIRKVGYFPNVGTAK
mgnify:CR=1 FL=1